MALRDTMAWHMRLFAEKQTQIGKKALLLHLHPRAAGGAGRANLKATHAAEIVYVFNNLQAPRIIPGSQLAEAGDGVGEGRAMADQMSSYWVNFAKNGDPNGKGLPQWPVFKDRNAPPHVIGDDQGDPCAEVLNAFDRVRGSDEEADIDAVVTGRSAAWASGANLPPAAAFSGPRHDRGHLQSAHPLPT